MEVSFIIIEYHSVDDVIKCVSSLKENCKDINYEIIVSSNSLYDINKQNILITSYPDIIWSFNKKNGGFAYGMNCGIKMANGEFIVLQNPDTTVQNNKLSEVLEYLKRDETIGIIGPKILNHLSEIQDTCRTFLTPRVIFSRLIQRKIYKKKAILDSEVNYDKIQQVNWVIGAYMIISKKALDEVGLLNERFFMYVEDMELCLRFWEKNFKVIYYPPLVIKYEGDRKSTLGMSKYLPFPINKYTFIHIKNYIIFLNEHGIRKIKRLQKFHLEQ